MQTDYNEEFSKIINSLDHRPTLLLHSCCAPCSSAVLERVAPYFDITLYYFNPNITSEDEYKMRLEELRRFVQEAYSGTIPIIDGGFAPQEFEKISKGLEDVPEGGARCSLCYAQRLSATALLAEQDKFEYFCTTLSVSPYKDAKRLNDIGLALAKKHSSKYLVSNFSKNGGAERSVELSNKYNLYQQSYCGCVYSIPYGVPPS